MAKNYKELPTYSPMSDGYIDFETYSDITQKWDYFGLHCHDFFEFYILLNGDLTYYVSEQVISLKPYSLVILPPFHLHGIVGKKTVEDYQRSWIYLTQPIMEKVGMGVRDFAGFFTDCVKKGKISFDLDYPTAMELKRMIEKVRDNKINQKLQSENWDNYLCIAGFLSKVYEIANSAKTVAKPIVVNETMQRVLEFLNNHFTEDISIPDISKKFGIGTSYLSRSFPTYTGKSVYDYVLYRRIMLAKELIYAGKTFTEIAFECGFNDYSCFLRSFTKITGQSPRAYKNTVNSLLGG